MRMRLVGLPRFPGRDDDSESRILKNEFVDAGVGHISGWRFLS